MQNLRNIRKQRGDSQTVLYRLSGVGISRISNYETGKHVPTLQTAQKLAASLDCTIDELVSPVEGNDNYAA